MNIREHTLIVTDHCTHAWIWSTHRLQDLHHCDAIRSFIDTTEFINYKVKTLHVILTTNELGQVDLWEKLPDCFSMIDAFASEQVIYSCK